MKTIYKFPLDVTDENEVSIEPNGQILCVQLQQGMPFLWALVDPTVQGELRVIETYGTGHQIEDSDTYTRRYIGTYQQRGGSLVFHVFERFF